MCVEGEWIHHKKGLIFIKISEPNPRPLCLPVSCDSFVPSPFLVFLPCGDREAFARDATRFLTSTSSNLGSK